MSRKWKVGDVYAPHDLTGVEMAKWKKLRRKSKSNVDVVDLLGIDPRQHYKVGWAHCSCIGLVGVRSWLLTCD